MADEAKQKQQSEQVKATEVKGYAKSVMSGAGASAVPMSFARVAASKAPVVVATGPVLKASAPSPVIVDGADGWKVVGKSPTVITSGKSPSVSATANRPGRLNYAGATGNTTGSPSNANGEAPTPLTKSNGASAQMLKWCRDTLKPVSKETSLNVDEFISILMSVDIKESSTITMICDHSIGGFTAIDSRKFADEFIQKRRAELSGQSPWTPTNEPAKKQPVAAASTDDDAGWTAVGGHGKAPQLSTNPITTFASDNKFTAVVGKGQSGNKKKKNKK
ncbi:hypothetical protein BC833DRAFT_596935 [Globomyces pollinis-pini]|nr:hypothetical protein BC833DRAFT_596935 [Globomyces pollinis-pini]